MSDSDECDLDALTSFLDESDDEDDNGADNQKNKEEKKDQCSMEEITAFLEGSDEEDDEAGDEEGDRLKQKVVVDSVSSNNGQNSKADVKTSMDVRDEEEGNEFSDFDDMDLDEIDNLEVSQNNSPTLHKLQAKGTEQGSSTLRDDNTVPEEMEGDVSEECPDDGHTAHDAIKAEMAAMAARMKELQNMLEKNTPKGKTKDDSPKVSSKTKCDNPKVSSKTKCDNPKVSSKTKCDNPKVSSKTKCDNLKVSCKTKCDNLKVSSKTTHATKKESKPMHTTKSANSVKKNKAVSPSQSNSTSLKSSSMHIKDTSSGKSLACDIKTKDKLAKSPAMMAKTKTQPVSPSTSKNKTQSVSPHTSKNKNQTVSPSTSKTFMASSKNVIASSSSPKFVEKKNSTREREKDQDVNPFFNETGGQMSEVKVDSRTIFGDSDDSDWDDLAGEEKSKLSDEGRELKKMLNGGERKREAHTPKYDPAVLKKPAVSTWTGVSSKPFVFSNYKEEVEKPKLNPETGTVSGKYRVKEEYMPKTALPTQNDNREFVQDPYCGIRIVNPRISMTSFKTKMDGRALIKISRLLSKFGTSDLQKDNWVTLGVVVHKTEPRQSASGKTFCIWKLSDLNNCDQTVTFFLFGNVYKEHWKNELGVVVGLLNPSIMDKAEKVQSEVALTIKHPQQLLLMGVAKDLGRCKGTTKAGAACGNFINRTQGEYCTYHVQAAYRKQSSRRTELQACTGKAPQPYDQKKRAGLKSTAGCFFYGGQTFSTMTPRTTNPKDKVTLNKLHSAESGKEQGRLTTMSLHELKPEDTKKLQKIREKDKQLLDLLAVPTVGSMNFVKHLVKKDKIEKKEIETPEMQKSAKDLLKQHQTVLKEKQLARKASLNPLAALPKLGKGLQMGQEISLDVPVKKTKVSASAELAKQLAIAKVKTKGGLSKEDPNAVRKKITSPENREKIKKRVAEDMSPDNTEGESTSEPPKKKSKLLGDLDLNSVEVQKLLKAKSKHKGALAEAEAEHEEKYFSALEKKERMEEKMDSIMEVPVTLFVCKQCNYKFYSLHDRCKQENHSVKKVSGIKRFYKCKQCKKRCTSFDKMPTKPCKECGSSSYERVSMLKERAGPKLESEELSLRGNEQKYVGALQGKSYLSV